MAQTRSDMPAVVYGIGATKAGTSWLYRYLSSHPDCAMPAIKELHYFNTLENRGKNFFIDALAKKQKNYAKKLVSMEAGDPHQVRLSAELNAIETYLPIMTARSEDASAYLDFLTADADGKKLVGDITPAYALLPTERLKSMAAVAPVTKFVYLLRDPIDRMWSNIRMMARQLVAKNGGQIDREARKVVRRLEQGDEEALLARSDYAATLDRLSAAVPQKSIFVAFYERLFDAQSIRNLCVFLGISNHPADFEAKVHVGAKVNMDDEVKHGLQQLLAPQYAAVAARFPNLPEAWQRNMVTT